MIAGLVERAPLEGRLGALTTTNIQDEVQKALGACARFSAVTDFFPGF